MNIGEIRKNIFPPAWEAVSNLRELRWHRFAHQPNSSQAFCLSVWAIVAAPEGEAVRETVAGLIGEPLGSTVPRWQAEVVRRELLNEFGGNATNLDAVLDFGDGVWVVESKLKEELGACRQPPKHCDGTYRAGSDRKSKSVFPCRLMDKDNRRTPRLYWKVMHSLSVPGAYPEGGACPFAGAGFQVMRNIASAARLAELAGHGSWRVVFAYSPRLSPSTKGHVDAVANRLRDDHRARVRQLDYDRLAQSLASHRDPTARELGHFMQNRLASASRRGRRS
jgi:hypothetical protein